MLLEVNIPEPMLQSTTASPMETQPDDDPRATLALATMDAEPLSMFVAIEPDPLVDRDAINKLSPEVRSDEQLIVSADLVYSSPRELFCSVRRSRSEDSGLAYPRKGLLKKHSSERDTSSKLRRRVSFADSKGLQLEQIRLFDTHPFGSIKVNDDDTDLPFPSAPQPTASATTCMVSRAIRPSSGESRFVSYFSLPWSTSLNGFNHLLVYAALEDRKVCLEAFTIRSSWRISGTILVKNLTFHKRVFVRRSLDIWRSYKDVDASFVCSVNENVDRFRFELQFAFKPLAGTRLEAAFGCETTRAQGVINQYWDNNCKNNYAFWFNDKS